MNNQRKRLNTICTNAAIAIIYLSSVFALVYCLKGHSFVEPNKDPEICVELAAISYTPMFMNALEETFPLNDNADKPSVIKEEMLEEQVAAEENIQDVINIPISAKLPEPTKLEEMAKQSPNLAPKPVETPAPTPAVEPEEPTAIEEAKEPQTSAYIVTEDDIIACAKMLYGEARGCTLDDKQNCVRTVCNRCSDPRWPSTIYGCVTQRCQYYGYSPSNPVTDELYGIAKQVIYDWVAMLGGADVIWYSYNCFSGNGSYNSFYTI